MSSGTCLFKIDFQETMTSHSQRQSGHSLGVLRLTLAQLERSLFGETHRPQLSCRIAVFLAAVSLVPVRRLCQLVGSTHAELFRQCCVDPEVSFDRTGHRCLLARRQSTPGPSAKDAAVHSPHLDSQQHSGRLVVQLLPKRTPFMSNETHVAFVQLHIDLCPEPVQSKAQIRCPLCAILFHVVLHIEGSIVIVSGDEGKSCFVLVCSY